MILRHKPATWLLLGIFLGIIGHSCLADDLPGSGLSPVRAVALNQTVTLAAVGDVIMHLPIVNSCYNATDDTYDFRPIFAEIKPGLERADLTVAVLETPLAGPEAHYTGYPSFNSPGAIADALQWAGIDLVFLAHNHCLDRGVNGLQKTMAYLDLIGLPYTGCNLSPGEKRYRMMEVKGVKLAFLSYTTTTNGIKLPAGKEWMVNRFDYAKIAADISAARQNGANGIILALHTGTEYQRYPSPEQQDMAQHLLALGVDVVLGSHVHVVQPWELRDIFVPATGKIRTALVAYSLGNFLSNQRWRYSDCGLMAELRLEKPCDEPGVSVADASYRPLWVHRFQMDDKLHYRIKWVDGAEVPADPDLDETGRLRMMQVREETATLMEEWGKE